MMPTLDFDAEMMSILQALPKNPCPKLLLHSCCGPCSTAVLERLTPFFEIWLLSYNPNIAPAAEYWKRLHAQQIVLELLPKVHPIHWIAPAYQPASYEQAVHDVANTPEGGLRCERCIAERMREAAAYAVQMNCAWFTTTLSVSPHKKAAFINAYGRTLAETYPVSYLPCDFKKRNGYARSIALSKEMDLYRQDYCGCLQSLAEAEARRAKRILLSK